MKTFGFFVVLSMLFFTNAFGGACVPMLCNESKHDVDEMLTENGVTGGENNNKDGRFTSQMCFMCDTGGSSECNYGDTVAIVDNYGNVKNAWQCTNDAGVDDSWISYNIDTLPICGDSPLNATNTNMNNAKPIEIREGAATRGAVSQKIQQSRRISSLCIYRECMDNYEPQDSGWACMQKQNSDSNEKQDKNKETDPGKDKKEDPKETDPGKDNKKAPAENPPAEKKSCREQRTTLNGKACCDTLSLGKYDKASDQCICQSGMKFVIENGTGYCRPEQSAGGAQQTQYDCDKVLMSQIAGWKAACVKNADIISLIAQIESYCAGSNRAQDLFMTYYNTLLQYKPQQCEEKVVAVVDTTQQQANLVNAAYKQLTSIHDKFRDDVTVWKNAEGKFNTARLASDSIAGVVLGTAGGLITSNVVKKNQVEDGFEDLRCTIGGQDVANWGDQFRVGIQ